MVPAVSESKLIEISSARTTLPISPEARLVMVLQSFFTYFSKLPSWGGVPPRVYEFDFSFDRLIRGTDNLRFDVHLSPIFCEAIKEIIFQSMVRHADAEEMLVDDPETHWVNEREEFKRLCRELLLSAADKAKSEESEYQIDYLAQAALLKVLLKEIRDQFEILIERLNSIIWEKETSLSQDLKEIAEFKEKTAGIRQNRKGVIYNTSRELFQYLSEVQCKEIHHIRKKYFGEMAILPDEFFANPIIYQGNRLEDVSDDFLMIEEYVLLGRRSEDNNTYQSILSLLKDLVGKIEIGRSSPANQAIRKERVAGGESCEAEIKDPAAYDRERDGWLKQADTIDILFNYFQTSEQYRKLKNNKGPKKELRDLKKRNEEQKKFLNHCYKKFGEKGLIEYIAACFEMKSVYLYYCPPLSPQQIMQFLVIPKTRQEIESHLKRIKKFYGKTLSLSPLRKAIKSMEGLSPDKKKKYLIEFMKIFSRYHRDLGNYNMLRSSMEQINIISDQKTLQHSLANNTVYEFLFPEEQVLVLDEKPIVSHVVIKADLRGSMDIIQQVQENGLNPALYFSQNLYNPIVETIAAYGATKRLIDGTQILLSMVERQGARSKSFTVARACGLAIKVLNIIRRYNAQNQQQKLPILEIGIGVSFQNDPPSFFFDGEKNVMISSALVSAGLMAQCTDSLRTPLAKVKKLFQYYLYRNILGKEEAVETEEQLLHYNVNGIALSASGFVKLSEEIDLKVVDRVPADFVDEGCVFYAGKFPIMTEKYHRLVIRESEVSEIDPLTLQVRHVPGGEKYYEVCTNPKLYELIKKNLG